MRVLPILFNTEMVKAILDERKSCTRRNPFKFEMKYGQNPDWSGYSLGEYFTGHIETGVCLYSRGAHDVWGVRSNVVKPKYNIGDILYVRETWCDPTQDHDMYPILYKADFPQHYNKTEWGGELTLTEDDYKWRPSIHMPKEAARIWLKVTDVRVERLQDITEAQAKAEGAKRCNEVINPLDDRPVIYEEAEGYCIIGFKAIWNPTVDKNQLDQYGWDANPWVWVIEFERCEKPQEVEHGKID